MKRDIITKTARKWWSSLSINEMKAFYNKHFPWAWSQRWYDCIDSRVVTIYKIEK